MSKTNPKEELHEMIEALPKKEITAVKRFLEFILSQHQDSWAKLLENPPIDDEPVTEEDLKAIVEGRKAITEGRYQTLEEVKKEFGL